MRTSIAREDGSASGSRPAALTGERLAAAAVALGLVYAGLAKLVDLEVSFGDPASAIVFWPAAGVTVSVFILRPRAEWAAYAVAIVVADTAFNVLAGTGAWTSAGFGVANAAEPVVAALLVRSRLGGAPDLSLRRDLGVFIVSAACLGPALGAALGSVWPWLLDGTPIWPRLGRWFVGDAVGVLIVAPLIISVARPPAQRLLKLTEAWTFAVLVATLAVVMPWHWSDELGLPFVLIPVLSLIGMRMGTRAGAAAVFVVGVLVEVVTSLGRGPFAEEGAFGGLLVAQTYLATCAVSTLTSAALMTGLVSRDELALHDSLTGLANRRLLLDHLAQAYRRTARVPAAIGLVYADLDGFKQINDEHGHAAGDEVLVVTANRLVAVVRGNDTVARLGGDEFVVLLEEFRGESALRELMTRMTAAIEAPIALVDGLSVNVGASLGCAVTHDTAEDPEDFLDRADRAMYEVKRAGKARRRTALA